jgi:hypothetical protein
MNSSFAKVYTTKQNGSWTINSTWTNNDKPSSSMSATDTVYIKHDVNLTTNISTFGGIIIEEGAELKNTGKYIWMRGSSKLLVYGTLYVKYCYMYDYSTVVSYGDFKINKWLYFYGDITADFYGLCWINTDIRAYNYASSSYSGSNITFHDSLYVKNDLYISKKVNVFFKGNSYIVDNIGYIDGTASFEGYTYVDGKCDDIYQSDSVKVSGYLHIDEKFEIYGARFTITNTGTLNVVQDCISDGTNNYPPNFTNYGNLLIGDDLFIYKQNFRNYGSITINDKIYGYDDYENHGILNVNKGLLNNGKTFRNHGTTSVFEEIINNDSIINNGTLTIHKKLQNKDIIVNNSGATFSCQDDFVNEGSVTNNGTFNLQTFTNKDPFINNSITNIYVSIDNKSTITNGANGRLVLKSDSVRTATLICNGTINGSGKSVAELFLKGNSWHYVSIPVTTCNSNTFWGGALYSYEESTQSWKAHYNDENLDVSKGYDVYYKHDQLLQFEGAFRNESQTINVVKTSTKGYNLVSNPYPSAIDWKKSTGWNKKDIEDAVYIWDPNTQNISSFVNGVGANGGIRYVAPMQAFFIKCNNNTGQIVSNNTVRLHGNVTTFRSQNETTDEIIKLKVLSSNGYADEAVIRFNNHSSLKFDGNYDADKMWSDNVSVPQLFTMSSDFQELSINSMPEINKEVSIPVYLKAGSTANSQIEIDLENMRSVCNVYLEDRKNNYFHNMLTGPYDFMADVNDDEFRFILHFAKENVISIDTNDQSLSLADAEEQNPFSIYASDGSIVIECEENPEQPASVRIFNMVGKQIVKTKIKESYKVIELNAATAYYTVHVQSGGQSFTKKVLVR